MVMFECNSSYLSLQDFCNSPLADPFQNKAIWHMTLPYKDLI